MLEKEVQRVREGIELLHMTGVIDNNYWKQLMPVHIQEFLTSQAASHAQDLPFRLQMTVEHDNLDTMRALFLGWNYSTLSESYRRQMDCFRQVILKTRPRTETDLIFATKREIPIHLCFRVHKMQPATTRVFLEKIVELVEMIQAEEELAHNWECGDDNDVFLCGFPFYIDGGQIELNCTEITKNIAELLLYLMDYGVMVTALECTDPSIVTNPSGQALASVLAAITHGNTCSTRAQSRRDMISGRFDVNKVSLVLTGPGIDTRSFTALCSGLGSNTQVKKVTLKNNMAVSSRSERSRRWQWVAYSLFSHAASSSISSVRIREECLDSEDMDAMMAILKATYPEKMLMNSVWSPATQMTHEWDDIDAVCVKAGASIRVTPFRMADKTAVAWIRLDDDTQFKLINDESACSWVDILVPGYGQCWVKREHIDCYIAASTDEPQDPIHHEFPTCRDTLVSLSLKVQKEVDCATMDSFSRLVGRKLKSFTVRGICGDCVQSIVKNCPRLTTLKICEPAMTTLDEIIKVYQHGRCWISSLTVQDFRLIPASITHLAKVLSDPRNRLSCVLESLTIITHSESSILGEDNLWQLLEMLQSNKRLSYVELHIYWQLHQDFHELFAEHHQEPLPPKPLSLQSKLSFLSVVNHFTQKVFQVKQTRTKRRLSHVSLDCHVISLIFEFAATSTTRTVVVKWRT